MKGNGRGYVEVTISGVMNLDDMDDDCDFSDPCLLAEEHISTVGLTRAISKGDIEITCYQVGRMTKDAETNEIP